MYVYIYIYIHTYIHTYIHVVLNLLDGHALLHRYPLQGVLELLDICLCLVLNVSL